MNQDKTKKAIEVLKAGGVVVYPTDTCYGLAVDATNLRAVKKLYQLKRRRFKFPIHVIFPNIAWLKKIVKLNKAALLLMNKFLPGPLTLVLPLNTNSKSFQILSSGTKSLGIRLPNNKIAIDLVGKFGKPITTTSANIAGQSDCYSIWDVKKQFKLANRRLLLPPKAGSQWTDEPDYYLDGGKLKKTKPSTVVSLINLTPSPSPLKERVATRGSKTHVKILRKGPISERKIKLILNK